jgi:hypothetical protein
MSRIVSVFAALFASTLLFTAAAGHAQTAAGYYVATPAAPPTKTNLITHETVWRLSDTSYVANKAPEREAILCQLVAHDTGKLSAFSAGGQAFDADALAKCNAHAK